MSRGPKSEIEKKGLGDEIVKLRFEGLPQTEIAKRLGIKHQAVSNYLRKTSNESQNLCKTYARIELTREIAETKFSYRLAELQKNYENAIKTGQMAEAAAWSKQWGDALVELFKLTGAYERPPDTPTKIEIVIRRDDGSKT